jgi:hypothetical protein
MPRKRRAPRERLGDVHVRAECRPEPDFERFGWALLQYAKVLLEVDQEPTSRSKE